MSAPDAAVEAALETRLAALQDAPPIAWPQIFFTPPPNTIWLRPSTVWGRSTPESVGLNARMLDVGIFMVDVFGPTGKGEGDVRRMAAKVRDHFPPGLALTSGGVTVRIRASDRAGTQLDPPDWLFAPISIGWQCWWRPGT